MTDIAPSPTPPATPASLPELSGQMADELARLEAELGEVDLLVEQAQDGGGPPRDATRRRGREAQHRHGGRRARRAAAWNPPSRPTSTAQLVLLTKRAALMESQVDVLEGKRRALDRYRDALAMYVEALTAFGDVPLAQRSAKTTPKLVADTSGVPPAVSRLLLGAQEDLRREIARAMHDGPAQSLTNIVLQAQIVERLVATDPAGAGGEVRQLVAMVQQTLEATKSFIFDVRPMVLDDLGLVPTLRRAARERGRRAGVPVEFDSMGHGPAPADGPRERAVPHPRRGDGRLSRRAGRPGLGPARLVRRARGARLGIAGDRRDAARTRRPTRPRDAQDLPPALAAMMADRRADARDAVEAAKRDAIVVLPPSTWREIQSRAATLGMCAELSADGAELRLVAEMPPMPVPPSKA